MEFRLEWRCRGGPEAKNTSMYSLRYARSISSLMDIKIAWFPTISLPGSHAQSSNLSYLILVLTPTLRFEGRQATTRREGYNLELLKTVDPMPGSRRGTTNPASYNLFGWVVGSLPQAPLRFSRIPGIDLSDQQSRPTGLLHEAEPSLN